MQFIPFIPSATSHQDPSLSSHPTGPPPRAQARCGQQPGDTGPSSARHSRFPRVWDQAWHVLAFTLGRKCVPVCVCVCVCVSTRFVRHLTCLVRGLPCAGSVSHLKWKSRSVVTCRSTTNNGNNNNNNSIRVSEVLGYFGRWNTYSQH